MIELVFTRQSMTFMRFNLKRHDDSFADSTMLNY